MSDKIKYEYVKMLDEYEELTNIFDSLKAETVELKERYKKEPENKELLKYIKIHEEKYRVLNERFEQLNARSKELLELSNKEHNDKK